ncbi:generated by GeneMarkS [hydrothermal vent metagenome]|uniref:Generated by GeneMarkS n=1 Tax=hydrothermal vent metagenome TaxID=652676 RepID=A0A3B0W102_9ZZZZ
MKNTAKLSDCRKYRFALWRTWDDSKPHVMFVGLNPSTADETTDDPTLTRCINFAKSWNFGGVCMANIFAYRATEPSAMKVAKDPIGSENNDWLIGLSNEAGLVVAAWGNDGSYLGRSEQVKQLLPNLHCLKLNKSGEPAHPLYQKADMKPVPMNLIIKNSKKN